MAPSASRHRSSTSTSATSNRPRPISRASTTSLHTTSDHLLQGPRHGFHPIHLPSGHPTPAVLSPFTPEEMISRSEAQLKNPEQPFAFDPSIQLTNPQSRAMSVDTAYSGNNDVARPHLPQSYSHDGQANQMFLSIDQSNDNEDNSKPDMPKKSKGNNSSQANEEELRKLHRENCHRNLKDVATSVLANERGPKSEKTKQIFAMNW